jgi:hypothetical protein
MARSEAEVVKGLAIGMNVKLKPDAFLHVKIRNWIIVHFLDSKILLRCHIKGYTLEVIPEDIEPDEEWRDG